MNSFLTQQRRGLYHFCFAGHVYRLCSWAQKARASERWWRINWTLTASPKTTLHMTQQAFWSTTDLPTSASGDTDVPGGRWRWLWLWWYHQNRWLANLWWRQPSWTTPTAELTPLSLLQETMLDPPQTSVAPSQFNSCGGSQYEYAHNNQLELRTIVLVGSDHTICSSWYTNHDYVHKY